MSACDQPRRRHGWTDDSGSILPLVTIYCLVAILIIAVVAAVSSLYLERMRLFSLADGASLAAAESYRLSEVRVHDGRPRSALTPDGVDQAVRGYLAAAPHARFDRLEVARADTDDTTSATVTLRAIWHPPLMAAFLPVGVPLQVTSTARSVFR